jgi:protein Tex
MDIIKQISEELNIDYKVVTNTVELLDQGATIPFIARYRKEVTNGLLDTQLRDLLSRLEYLRKLEDRKQTVIDTITKLEKLTPELKEKIDNCLTLTELEDIYRPYKPKKQTRGQIAIKKGLQPLANFIKEDTSNTLQKEASTYINKEKGVESIEDAIKGACDIIAEEISDNTNYRIYLKDIILKSGILEAKLTKNKTSDVYDNYANFSRLIKLVKPHQVLAIFRGEKQKCLTKDIIIDEEKFLNHIYNFEAPYKTPYEDLFKEVIKDSYTRLIKPSVDNDIYNQLFEQAEDNSIITFKCNLENLLMQAPLKSCNVMGFDPGYVNGCKIALVDSLSNVLYTTKTYVTVSKKSEEIEKEALRLKTLIKKFDIKYIALGNGTASRESEKFLKEKVINDTSCQVVIVSEAGASIYSASKLGVEEFPDFDVALRSAVSIARRLIDPLSELVKIDPESIGVGQYQHDINQTKLKEALYGVVEDVVNRVGVDLNYASYSLLSYVSGIGPSLAKNIVDYRKENGRFNSRNDLLKVSKFGPKAFKNAAGFLRIKDGSNFLDSTSIHPESYTLTKSLLKLYDIKDLNQAKEKLSTLNDSQIEGLASKLDTSFILLKDIINDLLKPGLDPRSQVKVAKLDSSITSIDDLKEGMILEGTIRNVSDFGCFVDIGLHEDGLVHISEISKNYVKNINDVVSIGDIIKVKVISIDKQRKRIGLSIKQVQ